MRIIEPVGRSIPVPPTRHFMGPESGVSTRIRGNLFFSLLLDASSPSRNMGGRVNNSILVRVSSRKRGQSGSN